MGIMLFSTVILPLIGRTARHHGPASGLIRRAVGPPAACSSPAVRQDNDAQNDRYRNDRGEPVHYAPIMHSGEGNASVGRQPLLFGLPLPRGFRLKKSRATQNLYG